VAAALVPRRAAGVRPAESFDVVATGAGTPGAGDQGQAPVLSAATTKDT
jgi:hypothetical protein